MLDRGSLWLAVLLATACAPAASSAPPRPASAGPGDGLTVTLLWSPAVDLDLYVTDPARETVYFANPRAASGGTLEKDATCEDGEHRDLRVETVRWPSPPPGHYRVGVDFGDRCGRREREVAYRLIATGGALDREVTGVASLATFVYRALEIDLPAAQSPAR